jgi:uncharacterized protein
VTQALHAIVGAFGLRGLCSLDFLLREPGTCLEVLEVNPRPPASLDLYAAHGLPVIDAHLRACDGAAPTLPASPSAPRGSALVFARREMVLGPTAAHWLAAQPDVHDLPSQATTFRAHDPVCSISAVGDDIAAVQSRLAQRGEMLLDALETFE